MNDASCFSITSIGDSASPCLLIHDRDKSYVGWLSADKENFHWATHIARSAKHSHQFQQHSFQRANSISLSATESGPFGATAIYIVKNFSDYVLLFLAESSDNEYQVAVFSLDGECLGRLSSITSWGVKHDIIWFHSGSSEICIIHFLSGKRSVSMKWPGIKPRDIRNSLICRSGGQLIILVHENSRHEKSGQEEGIGQHGFVPDGFHEADVSNSQHGRKLIALLARWDTRMDDSLLPEPKFIEVNCRLVTVVRDELPYKFCPMESAADIVSSLGTDECSMAIVNANGIVPLGFVVDCGNGNVEIPGTPNLGPSAQDLLNGLVNGLNGSRAINEVMATCEYYKIVRELAGSQLDESTSAMEMEILNEYDGNIELSKAVVDNWLTTRQPSWQSSTRSMCRFFNNLKCVWTSKEVSADLLEALVQLSSLGLRKIELGKSIVKHLNYCHELYEALESHKSIYAYLHARYDVLLGDGHWTLTPTNICQLNSDQLGCKSKRRLSITDCDLWDSLINESSNQNWNLIIRHINDLIASRIYRRFEITLGQNILRTQNLQVPWSRLKDIGGFGFPWGRHGALNRLDLYLDLLAAYLNACTQISPDRMSSLFRLRSYPEVAALTKLFTFSHNESSLMYKNIIDRALVSDFSNNDLDLSASQSDIIIGTMWNVLRQTYYLSGMILGYGIVRASHHLVECYPDVEDILAKLTKRSAKTTQSYISNNALSENSMSILDHALNYSDEADWFHDDLDDKKSPAVNQLLISLIFGTALTNQVNSCQILEILFSDTATEATPEARRKPRSHEAWQGGELLLKLHAKYNLKLLDGPLYLASALCLDRCQTTSMFLAHRLIHEIELLIMAPHTNIDTTVADCYDLKIDGSGLSWYKKLHNDSMHATKRQGLFLGSALGIHIGSLSDDETNDEFKKKCLLPLVNAYGPQIPPKAQMPTTSSTTLAPADKATLRPVSCSTFQLTLNHSQLLESCLMLALGIGFINWGNRFPEFTTTLESALFDSNFSLRDPESVFYRVLLWCLWHWQSLSMQNITNLIPVDVIDSITSSSLPSGLCGKLNVRQQEDVQMTFDNDGDFDESNCCVKNAIGYEKRQMSPVKHSTNIALSAGLCFALALKFTAQDDTEVTEFLLNTGWWMIKTVPDASDASLLLAAFSGNSEFVGANDTLKIFALNWIIAGLGLSCAGTNDEIVIAALDSWADSMPKFSIIIRVNSAKSLIKGSAKIRDYTKFVNQETVSGFTREHKLDPQRLGLDILASMPVGQHWGDNRSSLQLFDLFTELWSKHDPYNLQQRQPVIHIQGREAMKLVLSQHVDDEEDIYVTDAGENISNVNTLRNMDKPTAAHYPGSIDPMPIKSSRSSVLFLQRTNDI